MKRSLRYVEGLIDFASNDYLGLARSVTLKDKIQQEWQLLGAFEHGYGSTGSRLLTGHHPYSETLEQEIATFHGFEAGLLFNCGYMANLGLISSMASDQDVIIYDTDVHASTHDGIRLSKARGYPFRHQDLKHLEERLSKITAKRKFVCVESIYSMDGSKTLIKDISAICKQYGAHLIVDEAHAVGVVGPQGRGVVFENAHVFAIVVTFGKALGVHGAIVLGSQELRNHLINCARSFIYTTALPLQSLVAIKCAYAIMPTLDSSREHLKQLSSSHILSVKVKGKVHEYSQQLAQEGFDVRAICRPTVREECLRICLHAYNTKEEWDQLLQRIENL